MARFVAPLLIFPVLLCGFQLAPPHAHEFDGSHADAVVHSHFEPHHSHFEPHHLAQETNEPGIEPGEHVIWLRVAVLHVLPFQLDAPVVGLTPILQSVAPSSAWTVIAFDEGAPPHGPPRSTISLRAPPALLSNLT